MNGKNFQERADLLARFRSHSDQASQNKTGTFQVTLNSLQELKELLYAPGETQTVNRNSLDGSLEEILLQKTMLYVWEGKDTFEGEEKKWVESVFPLTLPVMQTEDYVIEKDLPIENETYYIGNFKKVTLKKGICISVINTPFEFHAEEFVREGTAPAGKADFNIIGKSGGNGTDRGQGALGKHGKAGDGGNCSSAGIAGDSGKAGENAGAGDKGEKGGKGMDGSLPPKATIQINQLTGRLAISSQTGAGGNGGKGGKGGNGGDGGKGGDGANCGCTGSRGGNGGNAGSGGQGGQGGDGGDGGDGRGATGIITVSVPAGDADKVSSIELMSAGGTGGNGGTGGKHGTPGTGGSGGKHNSGGSDGSPVIPPVTTNNNKDYGKAEDGKSGNNGNQGYPVPIIIKTR